MIEKGGSTIASESRITTTATVTTTVSSIRRSIQLKTSQALPPALNVTSPSPPETLTVNQSKNMKMKRRTADPPAIFSPVLSLSASIASSLQSSRADATG